MEKALTRAIGANLAHWRKEKGFSLAELAARMGQLGMPLNLNGINKIERGARGVDLDELVVLARALDVPPLLLIFPIGRQQTVEVLPGVHAPAWPAALWFTGEELFPGERYGENNSPIEDFRAQDEAIESWRKWRKRADDHRAAAARTDDPKTRADRLKQAELSDDTLDKIIERDLRLIREHIRGWGLDPGKLPAELAHIDGADHGER